MDKLKIVKGNTFETVVEIRAYKYNGEEITDFDLNNCTNISIINHVSNGETYRIVNYEILDAKHIQMRWDRCVVGDYSLEVTGKLGDDYWRFYDKKPIFSIVNTNAEAHIPQNSIIREDCYQVDKQKVYIVCPKGDKGDKGDKGATGPTGKKGDPFKYEDFTQEQLNSLKGKLGEPGNDGKDGSDGKSAYELAVENGYDGTVQEWLTSLHGLDGINGKSAYLSYVDKTSDDPVLTEEQWIASLHGTDGSAFTYADFTPELLAALKGRPGTDGHSPVITASKSGDTTTIYSDGASIATIIDGQDGSLANLIQSNWSETDDSSAAFIWNKPALATVATTGDYDDLINKPTIPIVPTNVSSFTNDAGYLTSHLDISGKADKTELFSGSYNDLTDKPTIPTVPTNVSSFINDAGYITSAPVTSVNGLTGAVTLIIPSTTGMVTSSTITNIEVVDALPQSPDANTIYIVQ